MNTKIKNFITGMVLMMTAFVVMIPSSSAVPQKDVSLDIVIKKITGTTLEDIKPINNNYVLKENDEFVVQIRLLNPSKQKIISTETWLSYDPKKFTGIKIDNADSKFDLITPGENEFVPDQSLVRIGRGNTSGGVDDAIILVTSLHLKAISSKAGDISEMTFYDFQTNELGHTNVNVISGGLPYNVLSAQEPKPIKFVINSQFVGNTGSGNVVIEHPTAPSYPSYPTTGSKLPIPSNIRLATNTSAITIQWDSVSDPRVTAYYVYYTTHKNMYLHRKRVVGNSYTFSQLPNGTRYYFVVTSADANDRESEYSAEHSIIVGQSNSISSTTNLSLSTIESLKKLSTSPASGPSENMLFLLLLSMLVYPSYRFISKKYIISL